MPDDRSIPVSVVIIAKDEEGAIAHCLRSAAFAREIVVVDSGSVDRTREIARDLGARVVETTWPDDYSEAKNRAADSASRDWILQLDADERVGPELAAEIASFFESDSHRKFAAARMPRKEIIFGKWIRHGGWYPHHMVRMYRRGSGAWTGRVHEHYATDGPVHTFAFPIVHESYASVHVFIEKFNRYSSIDAEEEFAAGKPFSVLKLFFQPLERFFGRYVTHGGWRDGFHGFALASLIALNYFMRQLKIWDMRYQASRKGGPDSRAGAE